MKKQKVREAMTSLVYTCQTEDSLDRAAQLLWEHDCGCLPVLDLDGVVRSMITDRDICMAAYTGGRLLKELRVSDSMSPSLVACGPDDDLTLAAEMMADSQVRRLPVVDDTGRPLGVLSINDMACCVGLDQTGASHAGVSIESLQMILMAVCRRRTAPCEHRASDVVEVPAAPSGKREPAVATDKPQKAKS